MQTDCVVNDRVTKSNLSLTLVYISTTTKLDLGKIQVSIMLLVFFISDFSFPVKKNNKKTSNLPSQASEISDTNLLIIISRLGDDLHT